MQSDLRVRFIGVCFVVSINLWGLIPNPVSGASQPSCIQAKEIVLWSAGHYGGGGAIELDRGAFAERVAQSLFEKLDPRHLLFLESDVGEFKQRSLAAWSEFIQKGSCGFFENSVQRLFAMARARFVKTVGLVPLTKVLMAPAPVAQGFAKTDQELRSRVRAHVDQVMDEATAPILSAYKNNRLSYLRDCLSQLVSEESEPLASQPRLLLLKAALGAMDSYSTYLSDSEFVDLHEDLSGGTTGIGVRLRKVPGGLVIESLVAGAPAEASGKLQSGDIITAVGSVSVADMAFSESRKLFRGAPLSQVMLVVSRGQDLKTVSLKRAPFAFENTVVKTKRFASNPSVVVVEIPSFYSRVEPDTESSSTQDLRRALAREFAMHAKPQALVLDVRGNPGGYLDEAVRVAAMFVGDEPVVRVVEQQKTRTLSDSGAVKVFSGPIVVLQDDQSASAAEILAGALRDYERAVVVGTPASFGKGSVQRLFNLDEESTFGLTLPGVVKLTTSFFYTPLGHNPANGGISSDIVVTPLSTGRTGPLGPAAPESSPAVDKRQLQRIQENRLRMNRLRAGLRQLSVSRVRGTKSHEDSLEEAVRIASDWVAFERSNKAPIGPAVVAE